MNSNDDLLLSELYQSPRDTREHQLAARFAPLIRFDVREPFLPIAAGITVFSADGPSPSMNRAIYLAPPGKPAARLAIEYAIWWDWDIHHLYELEHIWVYLGANDKVVRVEGSWHGKFNELALQMDGDHPVVLSEPGKHAFADRPELFQQRAAELRRSETQHVGALAHVLISKMFADQIRREPYDDSLARSYLIQKAFQPAWEFSQVFRFEPDWLVSWSALSAWIPDRVNAWLKQLDKSLAADDSRALRLISCDGTPTSLKAALRSGADGVVLPVIAGWTGRPAVGDLHASEEPADLHAVFQFCGSVPLRAMLDLQDERCIAALADFMTDNNLFDFAPVTAVNLAWLVKFKALAPQAQIIVQIAAPNQDPLALASECRAAGVLPRWERLPNALELLTPAWVERVHAAGLSVTGWPLHQVEDVRVLERERLDAIWLETK